MGSEVDAIKSGGLQMGGLFLSHGGSATNGVSLSSNELCIVKIS